MIKFIRGGIPLAAILSSGEQKARGKGCGKGPLSHEAPGELKEKHPIIGDVREIGLMIGVELVEENKDPAVEKCKMVY